ncbi:hypothetical protein [Aerobium aerolatum]|nr:hypothetical protein [Aquamicrobium aerolatum]
MTLVDRLALSLPCKQLDAETGEVLEEAIILAQHGEMPNGIAGD